MKHWKQQKEELGWTARPITLPPNTQDIASVIGKGPWSQTCGWSTCVCIFSPLARSGRKVISLIGQGEAPYNQAMTLWFKQYQARISWLQVKTDNPPGKKNKFPRCPDTYQLGEAGGEGVFITVSEVAGWVGWGPHFSPPQLIGKRGGGWFLRLETYCSHSSSVGLKYSHFQTASRELCC